MCVCERENSISVAMASATAAVSSSLVLQGASLASTKSGISGTSVAVPARAAPVATRSVSLVCRASKSEDVEAAVPRRLALALLAGVAAAGVRAAPANAAYGESGEWIGSSFLCLSPGSVLNLRLLWLC